MEEKVFSSMSVHKGFSVVEVLIAFSLFALIVASMTSAYVLFSQSQPVSGDRARAVFLAEEGLEAVRNISDEDFSNLVDGVYGLSTSSGSWDFSGSSDSLGNYTRTVEISTLDTDTKQVKSQVEWQNFRNQSTTVSLTTIFTFWDKLVAMDKLWSNATTSAVFDLGGNDDGTKVQIMGNYAYVIRNSGNPRLIIIDISDPAVPLLVGSNAISTGRPLNIFVSGNYAYIVGTQNNAEIQIVDISDPANPTIVGDYDLPRNADASGVYVVGNIAYITRFNDRRETELYLLDISNPTVLTILGTLDLNGDAREVVVSGNYAYIASTDDSQELQVIDVSNPATPTLVDSLNLAGADDALTISLFGNTLLMGQGNDLRIINISTPATPVLVSSLALGGTINDIAINLANSNSYVFVATASTTAEFQIVDVSDINTPTILTSIDAPSNLNGVAYDGTLDTAVAVGEDNAQEVLIFVPQ